MVEIFKLFTPNLTQAERLIGTEQRPITVVLDTLHEQIRNPQGVEQVTCSSLVFACYKLLFVNTR